MFVAVTTAICCDPMHCKPLRWFPSKLWRLLCYPGHAASLSFGTKVLWGDRSSEAGCAFRMELPNNFHYLLLLSWNLIRLNLFGPTTISCRNFQDLKNIFSCHFDVFVKRQEVPTVQHSSLQFSVVKGLCPRHCSHKGLPQNPKPWKHWKLLGVAYRNQKQ